MKIPFLVLSLGFSSLGQASVTVYYQSGAQAALSASATRTGATANYTGAAAYNPTILNAPPPPGSQALPTQFSIQLNNAVPPGASIQQNGSFFGFSIEMSVVNQVCKFIPASIIDQAQFTLIVGKNAFVLEFLSILIIDLGSLLARSCRFHSSISWQTSNSVLAESIFALGATLKKQLC